MLFSKNRTPPPANCYEASLLGKAAVGFKGTIKALDASNYAKTGLPSLEIEHRLMEMGFTQGASVEIKHEGLWGSDPIAVKVNSITIALRRRLANAILVCPSPPTEEAGVAAWVSDRDS